MEMWSCPRLNLLVDRSVRTKEFVVAVAFVVVATWDLVSSDLSRKSLYFGSETDVKYVGLLARWWLAGWCLVK